MAPGFMQNILTNGLASVTGLITSLPFSEPVSILKYIAYIGIPLLFAIIGGFFALKKRNDQNIIVIVWIITIFLLSEAYWFGINVYSNRLLIHLLVPISILGGFGLSCLYSEFKKKEFSPKIKTGFLITIFLISSIFALVTIGDSNFAVMPKYDTNVTYKGENLNLPQIVPPSNLDVDLAQWMKDNGNKSYIIISNNYHTSQFLSAELEQPIVSYLKSIYWIDNGYKQQYLIKGKSNYYYIYDKRLTFEPKTHSRIFHTNGNLAFFNNNYDPMKYLKNARLVYENKDYIVFEIKY